MNKQMKTRKANYRICRICKEEIKEEFIYLKNGKPTKSHYCEKCRLEANEKIKNKIKSKLKNSKVRESGEDMIIVDGFIFKKISDYHYINAYGTIWNDRHKRYIGWLIDKLGYCKVILPYGQRYIHRLVYENFGGDITRNMEINHKDLNKSNNYIDNLQLVTHQENCKHFHDMVKEGKVEYKKFRSMYVIDFKTNERRLFKRLLDVDIFFNKKAGWTSCLLNSRCMDVFRNYIFVDEYKYVENDMGNKNCVEIVEILNNKKVINFF